MNMNSLEFMKAPLTRIIADVYATTKVKITDVIEHGTLVNHVAYKVDPGQDRNIPIAIIPNKASMYSDLITNYRSIISSSNDSKFNYSSILSTSTDTSDTAFENTFNKLAIIIDRSFIADMRDKHDNGIDITHMLDKVMYPLIEKYIDNARELAISTIKMINTDMDIASILAANYGIHYNSQPDRDKESPAHGIASVHTPNYTALMSNIIDVMIMWYINEVIVNGNSVQPIADVIKRSLYNIGSFHSKDSIGFMSDIANSMMATGIDTNVFNTLIHRIKNTLYSDIYNNDYKKYRSFSLSADFFAGIKMESQPSHSGGLYGESQLISSLHELGDITDVDFDTFMECCVTSTKHGARATELYTEGLFSRKPKKPSEIKKAIVEIKREIYQCEREFEFMNDDRSKELAIDRTVDLLTRIDDLEESIVNMDRYSNSLLTLRDEVEEVLDKGRSIDVRKRRSTLIIDYPNGYNG